MQLIADEATDIKSNEQMNIVSGGWMKTEIFEEPLGLIQVPKTDSQL